MCFQDAARRMKFDCVCSVVSDSFATPWSVARQAPLSVGFPRKECWSGLPFPAQGIFLLQGSHSRLLHLLHCATWEAQSLTIPIG